MGGFRDDARVRARASGYSHLEWYVERLPPGGIALLRDCDVAPCGAGAGRVKSYSFLSRVSVSVRDASSMRLNASSAMSCLHLSGWQSRMMDFTVER